MDDSSSDHHRGEPASGRKKQRLPFRILVVDDHADTANSMSVLLQHFGADVRVAHDGLAAHQLAGEFRPEIVLMDIGMPKLDGYEAARRMRCEAWGRKIILIATTGWSRPEDRLEAEHAGFNGHLTKPVCIDDLCSLLERLIVLRSRLTPDYDSETR